MKALFKFVIVPVSDPDRSPRFYRRDQAGFDLDVDYAPAPAAYHPRTPLPEERGNLTARAVADPWRVDRNRACC